MNLPLWLGRIVCALTKHRRGREISRRQLDKISERASWLAMFQCPRCRAAWTRKVWERKPKQVAA